MNLEEIFLISRVFSFKIEKHHKMKVAYAKTCDFLKSLVCDFATIDIEIHLVLVNRMGLPPFDPQTMITEDIQEMSCGATNSSDLGIIFRTSKDTEKHFFPISIFHGATRKIWKIFSSLLINKNSLPMK